MFGAIGQVVSGFVSEDCSRLFSSIWIGITTVFNNVVAFLQQWGLTILAVIFAPVALIITVCSLRLRSNICRVPSRLGFHRSDVALMVQFFRRIYWRLESYCGRMGAAVGWFGSIWGGP